MHMVKNCPILFILPGHSDLDCLLFSTFYLQVVQSCISCLGAVVNKVTHNIRLVKDYFQKYHGNKRLS